MRIALAFKQLAGAPVVQATSNPGTRHPGEIRDLASLFWPRAFACQERQYSRGDEEMRRRSVSRPLLPIFLHVAAPPREQTAWLTQGCKEARILSPASGRVHRAGAIASPSP